MPADRLLRRALPAAALLAAAMALTPAHAAQQPGSATAPAAQAERPAAQPLFALSLRPGPAWKPGRPFAEQGLRPHFDYWMGLFRAGRIVTAGPVGSDSGLWTCATGTM